MSKGINMQPVIDAITHREFIIEEGSIEEVVELAKSYGVQPITNSTSIYKSTVSRIRQRLINAGLDPDNL